MNSVIFNVALPEISRDLSLNYSQISWISVGYSSIIAVGSLTYGKLASKYPIRWIFNLGIVLFCIGSVIGFLGYNHYPFVLLGRFVQATGASSFVILSMLSIQKYLTVKLKKLALSLMSISIALALGVGPLIGGVITSNASWKYLFLIMLTSLVVLVFTKTLLPDNTVDSSDKLDYVGLFLSFVLIISVMLSFNGYFWLIIWITLCGVFLTKHSKRRVNPFVDVNLFSHTFFKYYVTMGFLLNACHLSILFLLPLLLSENFGMSSQRIGIIFFLGSLFSVASSLFAKNLIEHNEVFLVLLGSIFLNISGVLGLVFLWNCDVLYVSVLLILIFTGYSPVQVSINSLITETFVSGESGTSLGMYNMFNFVGMAFGPALISKINLVFNNYSINFLVCLFLVLIELLCAILLKIKIMKNYSEIP